MRYTDPTGHKEIAHEAAGGGAWRGGLTDNGAGGEMGLVFGLTIAAVAINNSSWGQDAQAQLAEDLSYTAGSITGAMQEFTSDVVAAIKGSFNPVPPTTIGRQYPPPQNPLPRHRLPAGLQPPAPPGGNNGPDGPEDAFERLARSCGRSARGAVGCTIAISTVITIFADALGGKDTSEDGGVCKANACDDIPVSTPTYTPGPVQGPPLPPTATPSSVECSPGNPC